MRERILEVATAQFVRSGYDGVSMREIAEELQITKAALYYHFAGKADLLATVFTDYLDEMAEAVRSSESAAAASERLRRVVLALFALPPERRAIMRLAIHDVGRLDAGHQEAFGRAYRESFLEPLRELFADGTAAGEFVAKDPDLLVRLLLGLLYPFFHPPVAGVPDVTAAEVDDLLDVFLLGVTRRPPY